LKRQNEAVEMLACFGLKIGGNYGNLHCLCQMAIDGKRRRKKGGQAPGKTYISIRMGGLFKDFMDGLPYG